MFNNNSSPIIWYIPGFRSADDPQIQAFRLIQRIYPKAEDIQNIVWENQGKKSLLFQTFEMLSGNSIPIMAIKMADRWINALADVELWAELLAKRIANDLSMRQRRNLILIGHSLGGNIVIRTLSRLQRQNMSIHSAVLLGAAIGCKDENIPFAMKATQKPICSMVNPNDAALKVFQTVSGTPALGTGCKLPGYNHSKFIEYPTSTSINHSSVFYLSQWTEVNNVNNNISPIQLLADLTSVFLKNNK